MNEWTVIILILALSVLLAWYTGKYMAKVYSGKHSLLDRIAPLENLILRFCKIDASRQMNWKEWLTAFFTIHIFWLLWGFVILMNQHLLPLNPARIPAMEWTLALNTAVSFLTSTNLQHYSGETGASYFAQIMVMMFLQFVSAAASLAAGIAVLRGIKERSAGYLGNFYKDFLLSMTRILLPVCFITSVIFLLRGVPMTFKGLDTIVSLQGDTVQVARGPVAAFLSIKELGSNGGGFFGTNDAHPFENPDTCTFIVHSIIVFLLPMAFVFMIGFFLEQRKFSRMIFMVMFIGFLIITLPIIQQEIKGNPALTNMGILNKAGNMEGKEQRFGAVLTAFYCGVNVVIPAGTTAGMHDSFMPLSDVFMLIGMQTDVFFGGLGTGWINMFIFVIIAIFISTLMIGRTPELLGKKITLREMQLATAVILVQPLFCLGMTAIAAYVFVHYPGSNLALGWLSNTKEHGFTTMLYEFISAFACNGSEFAGLGNNTAFWNLTTIPVMLAGRFIPIAGSIIIAGFLASSKYTPPSYGTLKADSVSFAVFLFFVIIVVQVLCLFPSLTLGPIGEYVQLSLNQ